MYLILKKKKFNDYSILLLKLFILMIYTFIYLQQIIICKEN